MATYNIDRINFQGNTYLLRDTTSGYSTGGSGSGSVTSIQVGTGLTAIVSEEQSSYINTTGIINHSNSTTPKQTQGLYPITIDSEGHIASSGEEVLNISYFANDVGYLTNASVPEGASAYDGTISAIGTVQDHGSNSGFARGDHVHNITGTTIINALGFTPYNSTNPNGYITGITNSDITTALGYTPGTSNLTLGNTSTTAAAGNHTHTTTIATTNNTENIILAYDTKYQLTAGGTNYIFKMPAASSGGTTSSESDPIFSASSAATIFIATYGITTYANVQTAYNAGKTIFAVKDGAVYPLQNYSSDTFNFYKLNSLASAHRIYVNSSNWGTGSLALVNTVNGNSGAVTISIPQGESSTTPQPIGTAAVGSATTWSKSDHVHSITKSTIDAALQTTSNTTKFYREDGTWAIPAGGGTAGTIVSIVRW